MANRRPPPTGRRMDFQRNDRGKNFGRSGLSPWQGGGPGGGLPNLLPLAGGPTEATLALASNIINLLQPRQNPVPSLLDMPIRRDFVPNVGRYDSGYGPNRMGNHGNFRRTGNYNRAGERIGNNRRPFRPNDGQRQQNKSSPKKEADSKAKPVKESETEEKAEGATSEQQTKDAGDDSKKEPNKTRYDEIHQQLLKCHICNKSMWDGRSFENHLNGRAHAIMMQKTAESYALTADTMRQEFKIREMKRSRKAGQQPARDFYCAMCDMYAADGAAHRTAVGHRKLKKYLHPTCTSCHKEMPTRIELDEHRLSPDHLRNMQDKQDISNKPKPEVMVISTLEQEQSYVREDRPRRRFFRDRRHADKDQEDGDNKETDGDNQDEPEIKKEPEEEKEGEGEDKNQENQDAENTIVDYKEGDDLTGITTEMMPTYNTKRAVGRSFLEEFRCVQCRLCHKLLDSQETAAVHLRTWRHHQLFTKMIYEKSGLVGPNREANKRSLNAEEDGDSKRRKTDGEDSEQNGHNEEQDTQAKDTLLEGDADIDMPEADQLEDWEQSIDEILEDEKTLPAEETTVKVEKPEPEPVEPAEPVHEPAEPVDEPAEPVNEPVDEAVPEPEKPKTPPQVKRVQDEAPRASPRGRGRGRGRARGRY